VDVFSAFFNRLIKMSDLIAYPGVQQWWETRKHWHTEEFDHVVAELIAKGSKPKAFSTYNLREIVGPKTDTERSRL
jgi:hypothetical protein